MARIAQLKRRKVDAECRIFQECWTEQYFFMPIQGKLVCLLCSECVSVQKKYNLMRHYNSKHAAVYDAFTAEERKGKLAELQRQIGMTQSVKKFFPLNGKALQASYAVSKILAGRMKLIEDGALIKECLTAAVGAMCPKEKESFESIDLDPKTIVERIEVLAEDIKSSLRDRIVCFRAYSLALIESVDVRGDTQIAVYVRGVDEKFDVTEELVALISLEKTVEGEHVFEAVVTVMNEFGLNIRNLVGVLTSESPAMTENHVGCVSLLKKRKMELGHESLILLPCFINQEEICTRVLQMSQVISITLNTLNFVQEKQSQFQSFIEALDSGYEGSSAFSDIHQLEQGAVLEKCFALRFEIDAFMKQMGNPVPELSDCEWVCDLAFAVDVTNHLRDLDTKLQGDDQHVGTFVSHVQAFRTKLQLWTKQLHQQNLAHFPVLASVLDPWISKAKKYSEKINRLHEKFDEIISSFQLHVVEIAAFASPFELNVELAPAGLQMELIDLQCQVDMKAKFLETRTLDFFAENVKQESFPSLRKHALKMASLFGNTCICSRTVSKMKSRQNSCLSQMTGKQLESVLRLSTTKFTSNMENVMKIHKKLCASH